jgi:hypothetical protein
MSRVHLIVHLVVVPDYGERLWSLPENEAAWVADTPMNRPVVEQMCAANRQKGDFNRESSRTLFRVV